MKKLSLIIGTFLLLSVALVNAQTTMYLANKIINKTLKHENRVEKKTLRKLKRVDSNDISSLDFKTNFGTNPDAVWARTSYFKEAAAFNDAHKTAITDDFEEQLVGKNSPKSADNVPINEQKYLTQNKSEFAVGMVLYNEVTDVDKLLTQSETADKHMLELAKGDKKSASQAIPVGGVTFYKPVK